MKKQDLHKLRKIQEKIFPDDYGYDGFYDFFCKYHKKFNILLKEYIFFCQWRVEHRDLIKRGKYPKCWLNFGSIFNPCINRRYSKKFDIKIYPAICSEKCNWLEVKKYSKK